MIQKFFGGEEVEKKIKGKSKMEAKAHTDDIISISISMDWKWVVSGQVGPSPYIFVWSALDGSAKSVYQLPKGSRGVICCCISADNKYIAAVDASDDHNIYLVDVSRAKGVLVSTKPTGRAWVIGIDMYEDASGKITLGVCGVKYLSFASF